MIDDANLRHLLKQYVINSAFLKVRFFIEVIMELKLSRPFKYEGQEITELNVDLESLTTKDYEQAERELLMTKKALNGAMLEMETSFVKIIACKALKKPFDFLDNMAIADFTKLKVQTQGFLLTGSTVSLDS